MDDEGCGNCDWLEDRVIELEEQLRVCQLERDAALFTLRKQEDVRYRLESKIEDLNNG